MLRIEHAYSITLVMRKNYDQRTSRSHLLNSLFKGECFGFGEDDIRRKEKSMVSGLVVKIWTFLHFCCFSSSLFFDVITYQGHVSSSDHSLVKHDSHVFASLLGKVVNERFRSFIPKILFNFAPHLQFSSIISQILTPHCLSNRDDQTKTDK
jgi:hypothetical protein